METKKNVGFVSRILVFFILSADVDTPTVPPTQYHSIIKHLVTDPKLPRRFRCAVLAHHTIIWLQTTVLFASKKYGILADLKTI